MAKNRTKKREKQLRKVRNARQVKQQNTLITMPENPQQHIPEINMDAMLSAIARKDQKVWQAILEYLHFFELHHYLMLGRLAIKQLNQFVHVVFTALACESFLPEPRFVPKLIQMSHIFQHLVAQSSYQTTDAALDVSMGLKHNAWKMMFTQNPRNEIQVDQEKFFESDPYLASLWYLAYMMGISSPSQTIQQNMFRHLELISDKFIAPHHALSSVYFGCTYHNQDAVRKVKKVLNRAIKDKLKEKPIEITNNPNPKSIAVVTCRWHRNHAVYKSQGPLLEQLKDEYDLTLVWTGDPAQAPKNIVKEGFKKIVYCYFKQGGELVVPDEVRNNDFQMVYFPDVGMSDESIWLSNVRMAPIQAVGYGHPDTTGDGNEIDYYICGQVEKDADAAYSETRVCIPGLAQEPAWPTADKEDNYRDDGVVRINCVWGPDKYNYTLLTVLAEINKQVREINPDSNHEFHLFGSPGLNRYAALPSFIRNVKQLLPNAQIHSQWEYYDYMREMQQHDFALNSFPFGCYNVLVESLWAGIPFLTLVGTRFYNRAGMYLNDKIEMSENNFTTARDLIGKAVHLITDPDELKRQREHLASIDLKERLFTLDGTYFKDAFDYILSNHPFNETVCIGEQNDEAE